MKIALIIIGAVIGMILQGNKLAKKEGMQETLSKAPIMGCFVFLVYGVIGGVIGWLIYSLFS